ncbi:hypothetical protein BJ170DRAFT_324836 [Xylariales sp. AK1849]|nr:hypothetical protein BJ170DRAFT_324836 [Xylariales sp. AK1849]
MTSSNPYPTAPIIPHIHLLCMQPRASDAFKAAVKEYSLPSSTLSYTVYNTYLSDLPATVTFDCVVSPANSYGILDGGFDDALSRALAPKNDYGALTRAAHAHLHAEHRGFLPPGSCSILRIPDEFRAGGQLRYHRRGWGCQWLALCPTMRVPQLCDWDREVVYECIWSLLNAVERHNAKAKDATGEGKANQVIRSILMTPLGTGTGGISAEKWARQAVLAMKHFVEAVQKPETWTTWFDVKDADRAINTTHGI